MGADLIKGPVGKIIGLIVWMAVFSLLLGSINQWYLQAKDAGVVGSERFDRITTKGAFDTADAAWADVTTVTSTTGTETSLAASTGYTIADNGSGGCQVNGLGGTVTVEDAFTPSGTKVKTTAAGTVSGCKFSESGSIFNTGGLSGLIAIILQAAGLAPPIALLFILGTFGQSFIRNLGGHPILAAVGAVIMLLLLATLFNTLVPFLATAFEAIDGNRFVMYAEGLGAVSTIVGDFFGVVLAASTRDVVSSQGADELESLELADPPPSLAPPPPPPRWIRL